MNRYLWDIAFGVSIGGAIYCIIENDVPVFSLIVVPIVLIVGRVLGDN